MAEPPHYADGNQGPAFAVVMVDTALGRRRRSMDDAVEKESQLTRAFHYAIPQRLRDQIALGQLVWVPFTTRYLQGIVVDFDSQSPVEQTRDIDQIVDLQPVLSQQRVALAQWISQHYLAPIHQIVHAMLPPGVLHAVDVLVRPSSSVIPTGATQIQARILGWLIERDELTLRQIGRLAQGAKWRPIVEQMVGHGWVTKQAVIRPPTVRPHMVAVIRARAAASLDALGTRSPKQRQALDYLLSRYQESSDWIPMQQAAEEAIVSTTVLRSLVSKQLAEESQMQVWRDPLADQTFVPVTPPELTPDQSAVWDLLKADLERPGGKPFLLQGVTGSGKTELYLRAVRHTLAQGRGAIVLVPEIALAPQTIRRFGARFPTTIAVMHSGLSAGERYDQWRRIRAGELRLVIGSRSAIFAPVADLGLIVLDEEHEWTYKQERQPHYHARHVATQLAALYGATCILGSATPDLESAYLAERHQYERLCLPKRILGHRHIIQSQQEQLHTVQTRYQADSADGADTLHTDLPPVEIVDMRAELRAGNTSIFARSLQQALSNTLAAGEQAILFLNRRGSATFVNCRDCGYVASCPRCEIPYTYHSANMDLVCHHCNRRSPSPTECPECGSRRIRYFGAGTERVEQVVRHDYPEARIVRWDADTTAARGGHEAILDRFIHGEADVMIGTQMIAKGLDLPQVTLVGVVSADTMLHLPDLRAAERTFQILTQVAGRAGRSILGGQVIVQTYNPEHPAIQAASHHDYESFYAQELAFRREHWYPPISKLVKLEFAHSNRNTAQEESERMQTLLADRIVRLGIAQVDLLGPAPCFFARLRGRWRWQLLVRGLQPTDLLLDISLPPGWSVDVDPVSLL